MYRIIIRALFLALLAFNHAAHSEPVARELLVTLPGDNLEFHSYEPLERETPPAKTSFQWYSASLLENGSLKIGSVTQTRLPDWVTTVNFTNTAETSDTSATSAAEVEPVNYEHALDLPDSALLGFKFYDPDEPITDSPLIPLGTYPSAAQPFLLTTELRVPVTIGKESWTLSTEYVRRKDGKLLAGSLALIATNSSGRRMVLVPPAAGMAFTRQEVLWVGSIAIRTRAPKDSVPPSLILRRTWITGEIDYIVLIDGVMGDAYFDPDRAMRSFSSGEGEHEPLQFFRHVSQHRQPPSGGFGVAAFEVPNDGWFGLGKPIAETGLPETLFDRQLVVNDEPVRFTLEYLPSYVSYPEEPSSASKQFLWEEQLFTRPLSIEYYAAYLVLGSFK